MQQDNLRVTLVQSELVWLNPIANRHQFEKLIRPLSGVTDLIVLPEMFTTGFMMKPELYAETFEGETLNWMKQQAQLSGAAIVGSVAMRINKGFVNRLLFVTPDGSINYYDKRHLFRMGNEQEHYQAGEERKVFNYRGWRILPQVCYDLRFPVFMRNRNDYDLAIVVANWPAARRLPWRTLLQARAIENQSYVIGVNRVGKDGNGLEYSGDSLAINFRGDLLIDKPEGTVFSETTTFKSDDLKAFRAQFPAWQDGDEFEIKL